MIFLLVFIKFGNLRFIFLILSSIFNLSSMDIFFLRSLLYCFFSFMLGYYDIIIILNCFKYFAMVII